MIGGASTSIEDTQKPKTRCCRQGMNAGDLGKFLAVTIGLTLGLGVTMATAYRANVAANWEERRCDPGVVPIAGAFKPASDPRTTSEFARDNWRACQKEYIQRAVATAAEAPKALAAAQGEVVAAAGDATDFLSNVFTDVWRVCYEAYSTFLDRMKHTAQLFQNTLIQIHSIVGRLQASALAIVYALISSIMAFIDAVKVTLIVAVIVIGILVALQIILFFLFLPISGLIITMTFVLSMVLVAVATAIAAAMVSELFAPGACFAAGTLIALKGEEDAGAAAPIETIRLGTELRDGGRVTAIHRFWTADPMFDVRGVRVTGDHLVVGASGELVPVDEYSEAREIRTPWFEALRGYREVWCLTTTTRRIPCVGTVGGRRALVEFADWEEIPEEAQEQQLRWQSAVWLLLNEKAVRKGYAIAYEPSLAALKSEAALAGDVQVAVQDPWTRRITWTRVADVSVGARVLVGRGGITDLVTGRVDYTPDSVSDVVETREGKHRISAGCWIYADGDGVWTPAVTRLAPVEGGGETWVHLYTTAGTILLRDGTLVRDASDVGLHQLEELNDAVVLGRPAAKSVCI